MASGSSTVCAGCEPGVRRVSVDVLDARRCEDGMKGGMSGEGSLLDEMLVHASCKTVPGAYLVRRLPCAARVAQSAGGGQTKQPHRRGPQGIVGFSRLLRTEGFIVAWF